MKMIGKRMSELVTFMVAVCLLTNLTFAEERRKNEVAKEGKPAVAESMSDAKEEPKSLLPTEDEIKAVMPKIEELTKGDLAAFKARTKTAAETAEALLGYITDDDAPVPRYVLRQMAFHQYVIGAEFGKAAELYSAVRNESGIEYATGMVRNERNRLGRPGAKALRNQIVADEKSLKTITALKSRLARSPEDAKLHEQLALEYVACGDWGSALVAFRDCKGDVSKVAKWELSGNRDDGYDAAKAANFWWAFADGQIRNRQIAESMKIHASNWYKKAVALNLLSGLDAKVAEKRIEECDVFGAQSVVKEQKGKGLYMVIDLTKVGRQAVTYLDEAPKGGWSDEFRTKKIALRRIEPGSFEYLPGKSLKITKPFYIGVFEVTQKQYEMTMKKNPSEFKGDMRPVERVSYIDIRGGNKGLNWPKDGKVDKDSYLGKLRGRIGLQFDLPTEAQWEYACRAGTKGDLNVDGVEMVKLGRFRENGGSNHQHAKVGSFLPNAWGLYDMHGNVWEWCLDRWTDRWMADANEIDPKGPAEGSLRGHRSGCMFDSAHSVRSSVRGPNNVNAHCNFDGFRLVCPADSAK